jgi:phospholipid/cholesterol/gamma-HCH transport system ATP-binding protein
MMHHRTIAMAEQDSKLEQQKAVEAGAHTPVDATSPETSAAEPLTEDVSPDVQETVQEFMAEAAQQNEAANEAVPDRRNQPGPYISFDHVYKSFGDFVVLKDVSFSDPAGGDALHSGAVGRGQVGLAADADGLL